MAQKLAAGLGLGVGISSGANFIGALMVQEELGSSAVVATVFPDRQQEVSEHCATGRGACNARIQGS